MVGVERIEVVLLPPFDFPEKMTIEQRNLLGCQIDIVKERNMEF